MADAPHGPLIFGLEGDDGPPPRGCVEAVAMTLGASFITETTAPRFLLPAGDFTDGLAPTIAVGYRVQASASLTRFQLRIVAGAGNGLDIVYTVNLNGVPTAYTITQPSTASGDFEIVGPPLALVDGDMLDVVCTKAADVAAGPVGIQAFLRLEQRCAPVAACCPPAYLHQNQWDAYAVIYPSVAGGSLDLDASMCGQDEPFTATIRASFFSPPGTPPLVTLAAYDALNNIFRVGWDNSGEDGRFIVEITNGCGCCFLFPIEGVSV